MSRAFCKPRISVEAKESERYMTGEDTNEHQMSSNIISGNFTFCICLRFPKKLLDDIA